MAVVTTVSNHAKYMHQTKKIDGDNDVFKVILMNTTFSFDKDTHSTLADVTADQLATGGGYTQDSKILVGNPVVEDDTNDKSSLAFDNPTWTATTAGIGPTGALIVYDDTTTDDTVMFCGDFGQDYTISDGSSFQPQNIELDIL